jgi:kynureninase
MCRPELRGWFSQENPFSWDLDSFAYAADARRFDHGTPAILASVASLPGLEWVRQTGIEAIRAQNRALTEHIIEHAMQNGWTVASPLDESERGGSVMLSLPASVDAGQVVSTLRGEKLYCDARGSTLRLSPGYVTDDGAVEVLCAALDRLIGRKERHTS